MYFYCGNNYYCLVGNGVVIIYNDGCFFNFKPFEYTFVVMLYLIGSCCVRVLISFFHFV